MTVSSEAAEKGVPTQVYIALILATISVAFAPILIRVAQGEALPSLLIAQSRLILASLAMMPITLLRYRDYLGQMSGRDWGLSFLAGLSLAAHFALWITSLEYTTILVSTVIVTSSPIWVAILEALFLKQRLPQIVVLGLAVAVIGGLVIAFGGASGESAVVAAGDTPQNDLVGGVLSLLAAITVSVYFIIGRGIQRQSHIHVFPYLWVVYSSAALILTVVIALMRIPIMGYSATGYLALLGLAVFPQLIGHSSMNYATKYLPATIVSLTTQLEPIGSAILAYFIFAELPLPLQLLGSAVVFCGVSLASYGHHQHSKAMAKTEIEMAAV